jgi:hypothetical protein
MGGHEGILINLGGAKSNHPKNSSLKKNFPFVLTLMDYIGMEKKWQTQSFIP